MKYNNLKKVLLILCVTMLVALFMFSMVACNDNKDVDSNNPGVNDPSGNDPSVDPGADQTKYKVVIFAPDGTELHRIEGVPGTTVTYVPAREGYDFKNYCSDQALQHPVEFSGRIGEGDTTLYTDWTPHTYTIRFNGGRAQGAMADISATYGKKVTLPANVFTYRDETFEEWQYVADDNSIRSIVNRGIVSNLTAKDGGVVTLNAIFANYDVANFVIEDGVVTAYNGSSATVKFPATARVISSEVFKNSPNAAAITKIEVPSNYTQIQKGAFAPLTALESMKVPFIGESEDSNRFLAYVFGADKYNDNEFSFKAEISYVSLVMVDEDFSKLVIPRTLKTVTVTNPVETIEEGAFYKAYSLEKLVIYNYDNLFEIGDRAFEGCINLGTDSLLDIANPLTFMSNVRTIGEYAFAAYVSEENDEGGSYLFTNLQSIAPLDAIENIGDYAFYYCIQLAGVKFGNNLQTVGTQSFINCRSIEELKFPNSTTTIGNRAFANCTSLREVTIGTGVTLIDELAFAACSALAQVELLGDIPAVVSTIPFSNDLDPVYNDNDQIISFKPVVNEGSFAIYVNAGQLDAYKTAAGWSDYSKYMDTKGATEIFYYGENSDGSYATKFEVRGGSVVYITDTGLEFLDLIDWFSEFYNTFRSDLTGEEYSMSIFEVELEDGEAVGDERFFEISHPMIVDALNEEQSFLVRVRRELKVIDGKKYYVPTLEWISQYFGTVGDEENSLVIIERDDLGHYVLSKRDSVDGEFVATMPEGALYGEYHIYYILGYAEKMVGMEWFNAKGESIKTDKYLVADDCLYPVNGNDGVEVCFTDYPTQILLDGNGQALLSLYQSGKFTEYVGVYALGDGQAWGQPTVSVTLGALTGNGTVYNGTLLLDGMFDGVYHKATIRVSSVSDFVDATLYPYAGLEASYICYSDDESSYYTFYEYVSEDGTVKKNYVEYNNGQTVLHGEFEVDGKDITITLPNSRPVVGEIDDNRGSFHVNGSFGQITNYHSYIDWENAEFYMDENFYGTILTYYSVKMDGYGNALFHDEHDDGFDDYYIGTYYDTGNSIGGDENGSYDIYYFEGVECDQNGNPVDGGVNYSCYYVLGSSVDTYEDGYEGVILSVTQTTDDQNFVAYDEDGNKFADVNVSPFGVATLTVYDTEYVDGSYVSTVNEELTNSIDAVAYQTGAGTLVYIVAYDKAGNYLFRLSINENEEWEYTYEGELDPQPAPESTKIYPDIDYLIQAE